MSPLPAILAFTQARIGTSGPDLTRYLLVVGILIVALVAVAWGVRRLVSGTLRGRASGRSLAVLDVLPLGSKRQLTVVRCYDRTFALALGEKAVTLVAELDPVVGQKALQSASDLREQHRFERLLEVAQERMARRTTTASSQAKERSIGKPGAGELVG